MAIEVNQNETSPEKPARRAGALLQQIGLNMLMVGLLVLLGFLAWQRFFGHKPDETVLAQPLQPASGADRNHRSSAHFTGRVASSIHTRSTRSTASPAIRISKPSSPPARASK